MYDTVSYSYDTVPGNVNVQTFSMQHSESRERFDFDERYCDQTTTKTQQQDRQQKVQKVHVWIFIGSDRTCTYGIITWCMMTWCTYPGMIYMIRTIITVPVPYVCTVCKNVYITISILSYRILYCTCYEYFYGTVWYL